MKSNLIKITKIYDIYPKYTFSKDVRRFMDEIVDIERENVIDIVVLDKIRAEINGMYRVILKDTPKDDWAVKWNDCLDEVLQIIDKYKAESEDEDDSKRTKRRIK